VLSQVFENLQRYHWTIRAIAGRILPPTEVSRNPDRNSRRPSIGISILEGVPTAYYLIEIVDWELGHDLQRPRTHCLPVCLKLLEFDAISQVSGVFHTEARLSISCADLQPRQPVTFSDDLGPST
jgi:hypothetical protein